MPPLDEQLVHDVVRLDQAGDEVAGDRPGAAASAATPCARSCAEHGSAREQPHSALPARPSSAPSKLDPFRPQIDELLETYPDITAQRVFEILREKGFDGGYTVVKELVRRIRPKPAPKPSLETPPREPGEMAECDWSPYPVTFTHAPPMHAAGLRLHAALLDAQVLRLPRGQRAAPADGRPRARLRALRGRGAPLQVRQPEAGGAALGGRPADLQSALHRLRHLLRVLAGGLSPPASERQTPGREKFLRARR